MQTLLVYIYETCCLSEVSVIGWMINTTKAMQIKTFALTKDPITTLEGWHLTPDFALEEIKNTSEYLGLLFPGGEDIILTPRLQEIILDFDSHKVLIGAICAGPTHLALAGILKNYRYTTSRLADHYKDLPETDPFPRENFVDQRWVKDQHIITADGVALIDFTDQILLHLQWYEDDADRKWFQDSFTPKWE